MNTESSPSFDQLDLPAPLRKAVAAVGYETPSPIQAATIPLLLAGRDVVGQAQTGTGKTAAFALPILAGLDLKAKRPQALVLAPTRELAIQVAEAFQTYAAHLKGFHVLPVYGGQDYRGQIRALQRGVQVVVGTPGRVMDHLRRGTLDLGGLRTLVLDEGDEMLRMGFIDDVAWILDQLPEQRQIALFSATMPPQIRRIAQQYLNDPAQVTIDVKTTTAETIRQRYWPVSGLHKLDALTRILEAEPFDAMLIFVRTRTATVDLAEKLQARGHACAALSGDVAQKDRERTVERLKKGKLDILVATDVAARGLDVDRISHVLNYDIPYDTEAYVHRIGRTGRAGRQGDAILFVAPRERRLLKAIERATRQPIEIMELPSPDSINEQRIGRFKARITKALDDALATPPTAAEHRVFTTLIERYQAEHGVPALEIAAALAGLLQGDTPFLLKNKPAVREAAKGQQRPDRKSTASETTDKRGTRKPASHPSVRRGNADTRTRREPGPAPDMQRYRLAVGREHGVQVGNIVGAIANEAGIDNQHIGRVTIHTDHSLVDLPRGMPRELLTHLKKVWVAGQPLRITPVTDARRGKGNGGTTPNAKNGKSPGKAKKIRHRDLKNKGKRRAPASGVPAPRRAKSTPSRPE